MQTKTYFASSVPAALEAARRELGEDALLVNSKPSPAEARSFGRLQVTFAYESLPTAARVDQPQPAAPEIRNVVTRTSLSSAELRLTAAGMEADTAREIVSAAANRQGDRTVAVAQELAGRLPRAEFGEIKPGEARAIALVGPPGRGKTTTLVKIAMRYGLSRRIPVRIYSAGAHGVGGQEQMARYAAILGVPFQASESLDSLHLALNGESWKGLILIDTPGISAGEREEITEFSRFFSRRPEIEKHLVLRSEAHSADMTSMVNRFSPMNPTRLIFTGTDEARGSGAAVETMIRMRLPWVFAGTGQQIPEDLEEINVDQLARSIAGENLRAAAA